MNNLVKFPALLYQMDKLPLRDATVDQTHVNMMWSQVCGTERNIGSLGFVEGGIESDPYEAYPGMVIGHVANHHTFLTGDRMLIAGTTDGEYDGTHVVTRISRTHFAFTHVWNSVTSASTGTVVEPPEDVVMSPLDGLPAIKIFTRPNNWSHFAYIFSEAQTVWPNVGLVSKVAGTFSETDGILKDNAATLAPPVLRIAEGATLAAMNSHHYSGSKGLYTGEWKFSMPNKPDFTTVGTPAAWATDFTNQGFEAGSVGVSFAPTYAPTDDVAVIYIGGVATKETKAKLVIGYDGAVQDTVDLMIAALAPIKGKGCIYNHLHPTWSTSATFRAMLDQIYALGWDISNHTWSHKNYGETATYTIEEFDEDIAKSKEWYASRGYLRGADFIAYTGAALYLDGKGADIADKYFKMGRGAAWRESAWGAVPATAGVIQGNPIIPNDMLSLSHVAVHQSRYAYWTEGEYAADELVTDHEVQVFKSLRTTSAQPVDGTTNADWEYLGDCNDIYGLGMLQLRFESALLNQSVMLSYTHSLLPEPSYLGATPNLFNTWMALVRTAVAEGKLEVITMTDWYNEIYGVEKYEEQTRGGGGAWQNDNRNSGAWR